MSVWIKLLMTAVLFPACIEICHSLLCYNKTLDMTSPEEINCTGSCKKIKPEDDNPPLLTNLPAAESIYYTYPTGTYIFTVVAWDPDTNDVISIAMSPIDGQFVFNTKTNELFLGTLTASSGLVNLTFTVTDQCLNTDTNTLTVEISDPPPNHHDTLIARNVNEDIAAQTLLFTVNVTDAGLVTCSKSTSVPALYPFFVRLKPSTSDYGIYCSASPWFDYDVLSQYALQVDCTDGVTTVTSNDYLVYLIENQSLVLVNLQNATSITTMSGSDVKIFTVNITDPEGDNINCSMTSDPTNAPFDIFDYNPPSLSNLPAAGTVYTTDVIGTSIFTVSATDSDTNDVISIAMSPIDGQFDFDTTTNVLSLGTLTASSGPVNLTFTVTDQCLNTDTNIFTVTIVNPSPIIHDTPIARNVSEDIAAETLLFTVNVTDADLVTCSKSTSVPASYPFSVRLKPSTSDYGIYCSVSPGFDYDVLSQYALQVDCTDGVTTVTSNDYLVYLIENQSPVLVNLQNATSITTITEAGTTIFTVNIIDPEGDNINCSMTSDPANAPFDIFDSGAIHTTQGLSGKTNVGYDLFISCSDGRNTVGPETLTVTYKGIDCAVLIAG